MLYYLFLLLLLFGCESKKSLEVETSEHRLETRDISYMIWKREGELGPSPLVVISHGFGGKGTNQAWLARDLVRQGYVVATLNHRDFCLCGGFRELWERPLDVQALLDEVTELPYVDSDRIGMVGYSMGSLTALWLGGAQAAKYDREHLIPSPDDVVDDIYFSRLEPLLDAVNYEKGRQTYRDVRIKAYVMLAPTWAWLFTEEGCSSFEPPSLLIASRGDELVNTEANAFVLADWIPKAKLKEVDSRAGHFVFLNQKISYWPHQAYLFEDLEGVDREEIHRVTCAEITQFFRANLL